MSAADGGEAAFSAAQAIGVDSFVHRWMPGTRSDLTLLLLHGTGGDENDLPPLGPALAPGANLLSPRGAVLENGMARFFRRLAEGVFDVPDLLRRTDDLAGFVAAAAQRYGFDPARVVAVGFSNGANIAASLMLRRPETLAGAALLRPMVPFEADVLPDLTGRPVLIGAGRADEMVAPIHAETLGNTLARAGAEVTLVWSEAGHGLGPHDFVAVRDWMARAFPVQRGEP